MTPFEIVLLVYGVVLSVTALSVVFRMIVGPTILDRAISTDMLVVLVVIGMALYTATAKAAWAGPSMLGLTGLAFIGTVAFARFVAREDTLGAKTARRSGEATETGAFVAIDPDRYDHSAGPEDRDTANVWTLDHEDDQIPLNEEEAFLDGGSATDGPDDESGFGAEDETGFGADGGSAAGADDDSAPGAGRSGQEGGR